MVGQIRPVSMEKIENLHGLMHSAYQISEASPAGEQHASTYPINNRIVVFLILRSDREFCAGCQRFEHDAKRTQPSNSDP